MEIVLAVFLLTVGYLGGGKLATDGKVKVVEGKTAPLSLPALRPCVGAQTNCDK
jgi:hypothetical protein